MRVRGRNGGGRREGGRRGRGKEGREKWRWKGGGGEVRYEYHRESRYVFLPMKDFRLPFIWLIEVLG